MFGGYEKSTTMSRYIAELRGGKSLAGTVPCKNKVLKTGAATFGYFDSGQYKYLPLDYVPLPEHKVEKGDVIISRMNTPDLVGACSYVFDTPDNMYYPDRLWKTILKTNTNPIFLWQLLWEKDMRKAIKESSGGTSGTMHNISKQNLLAIRCIDVPLELQNEFAAFVEQLDKSKVIGEKQGIMLEKITCHDIL
jgi:type I restriction enzyme S subunit